MTRLRHLAPFVLILSAAMARAAGLEFNEQKKEIRPEPDAKTVIVDFPFTNKTGKPVTITKSDPKCACLTVQVSGGKFTYAPGESGVVRATMTLGNLMGTQSKTIDLWLGQSAKPALQLDLVVHIPSIITLDPKTVHWDIGGKPEPRTIHISMDGEKPVRITGVTAFPESFRHELKTLEAGRKYELVVTPQDTTSALLGRIMIETDCTITKHRTQQVFAQVRKPGAEANTTPP
jgi:hypothetical protein